MRDGNFLGPILVMLVASAISAAYIYFRWIRQPSKKEDEK